MDRYRSLMTGLFYLINDNRKDRARRKKRKSKFQFINFISLADENS